MAKNLQKLRALIQNSYSLSPGDKERLIQSLETLTEEELEKIKQTLEYEESRVAQISQNQQQQVKELNDEYNAIIQDFKHAQVPKIRAAAEKKSHTHDDSEAEQLINTL